MLREAGVVRWQRPAVYGHYGSEIPREVQPQGGFLGRGGRSLGLSKTLAEEVIKLLDWAAFHLEDVSFKF